MVTSLIVDHATLTRAAARLDAEAGDLDDAGTTIPQGGDYGLAAALLTAVLGVATETAARLSFEASTIGAAVGQCNQATSQADQDAAETFLVKGS